jgi:hypothetical protein
MLRETIVSAFAAGSARKRDYSWPDPNLNISGAPSNGVRDRAGISNTASGSQSAGAGAALTMGVINGVDCVRMTNGVNLGVGPTFVMDCGRCRVNLLGANSHFTTATDDYGAYRVYAIMRVVATPVSATEECGLTLHNGANASDGLLTGTGPGFAFYYNLTGGLDYLIKTDTAGFITVPLGTVAGGFDNTQFHTCEFRILGARPGANASIKCILDGKLQDQRFWPNNLPSPAGVGGNTANGFVPNLKYNSANGELDVPVGGFRVQYAPFEAALF